MEEQTIRILAAVALILGALIVGIGVNWQVRRQRRKREEWAKQRADEFFRDLKDLPLKGEHAITPSRIEIKAIDSMRGDKE